MFNAREWKRINMNNIETIKKDYTTEMVNKIMSNRPHLADARKDLDRAMDNIQEHMDKNCRDKDGRPLPAAMECLGQVSRKIMEAVFWLEYFTQQAEKEQEKGE